MDVKLAEHAGFCFGVKRAVDTVYQELQSHPHTKIYTYGPIVHNEQVVKELENLGVLVLEDSDLERLSNTDAKTTEEPPIVIIRAHGITKQKYLQLEQCGFRLVDATCPFVKKIHKEAQKAGENGQKLVITGNPNHPEVQGIVGWCNGPVVVVESPEAAMDLSFREDEKIGIVSQTTYHYSKFKKIVEILEKKTYNVSVVNTICNATEERQRSARMLASEADAMIVIGGRTSSNTQKLYEICKEECPNTYYIQTLDDLHLELPKSVSLVGITAGASTPQKIIEEVQDYVRNDL